MGFKIFFEAGAGFKGWTGNFAYNIPRAVKQYTPPNAYTTPPLEMFQRMSDWRLQVYSYILHLADAGELIEQNGSFFIDSEDIQHLHPEAIELLVKHHILNNSQSYRLNVPTIDNNSKEITGYPVDVAAARKEVTAHANAHQFTHGVKSSLANFWQQATTPSLSFDPSITGYHP